MPCIALTPSKFKLLVLGAADLREASYTPVELRSEVGRRYRLDYYEASELACKLLSVDNEFARPVSIMLAGYWNDALDWAGDCEGRVPTCVVPPAFVYPIKTPLEVEFNLQEIRPI